MNKILFISQHLPYPPLSGARRREFELLNSLKRDFEIHVCAISKIYESDLKYAAELKSQGFQVMLFKSNPNISFNSDTPVQIQRNSVPEAQCYISDILNKIEFDIIHCEGYYLFQLIPKSISIPIVLEVQNIEYDIWEQKSRLYKDDYHWLLNEGQKTKASEQIAWINSNVIVTVTDDDKEIIKQSFPDKKVITVSNGFNHSPDFCFNRICQIQEEKNSFSLLFVGNFDYEPNEDAAYYFCDQILPYLQIYSNDFTVYFVGNIGKSSILTLQKFKEVVVTGIVDNVSDYLRKASVFICPLRFGGGIKTKMLEAIYFNKPIVTSSVGAQGFGHIENCPLIIHDQPEMFAKAIIDILSNAQYKKSMEIKVENFKSKLPTWQKASTDLKGVYESCLIDSKIEY